MASGDERTYIPKDAVGDAIHATLVTGAAGLTIAAVQNSLARENLTGWGVFTRGGGIIAMFGVLYLRLSHLCSWH